MKPYSTTTYTFCDVSKSFPSSTDWTGEQLKTPNYSCLTYGTKCCNLSCLSFHSDVKQWASRIEQALEPPPNSSICAAAPTTWGCKRNSCLVLWLIFFLKLGFFPREKISLWGQDSTATWSFSLLPCHLCSVNHLRKNRKHLNECQQYGDIWTFFASNPIIHIGRDTKYLMCTVWWFCIASRK